MNTLINLPPYMYDDTNMIIIHNPNPDNYYYPEVFKIIQTKNNEYYYQHLEKNTHKISNEGYIDPYTFKLNLSNNYMINLSYGGTLIDPALTYEYNDYPRLLKP